MEIDLIEVESMKLVPGFSQDICWKYLGEFRILVADTRKDDQIRSEWVSLIHSETDSLYFGPLKLSWEVCIKFWPIHVLATYCFWKSLWQSDYAKKKM